MANRLRYQGAFAYIERQNSRPLKASCKTLKNKRLIITAIVFFLLVNTTYFWESKLGLFAFPAFLFLVAVFFVLIVLLLGQVFFLIKEKSAGRQRLLTISVLTTELVLAFLRPGGLVDFEQFEGRIILIAQREGAANCMTVLKLKENNRFTEKNVCFGITGIKGDYQLKNDTIFFENVEPGRGKSQFYKFAVIRSSGSVKDNKHFNLVKYKGVNDTTGHELQITKNDLYTPINTKPRRQAAER